MVLDNVIDPRNMGAIMRSSAIYGVDGIIINKNHCSPLTEVVKKVIVPEAREDARMLNLLQACSDNDVAVERSKKIKKNPQAIVSSMDIGDLKDLKNYLEKLSNDVPIFVVLDNVIDPRNMGAIMRSSAIYGVDGIITVSYTHLRAHETV